MKNTTKHVFGYSAIGLFCYIWGASTDAPASKAVAPEKSMFELSYTGGDLSGDASRRLLSGDIIFTASALKAYKQLGGNPSDVSNGKGGTLFLQAAMIAQCDEAPAGAYAECAS